MKKDELAYSANHNYREGYDDGQEDIIDELLSTTDFNDNLIIHDYVAYISVLELTDWLGRRKAR